MFAEVILPLPLYSTFTYSIPAEMSGDVVVGSRVLVQFGMRKFYTGIVACVHPNRPEGYDVKPLAGLLDPTPVVRRSQLQLWDWISQYYLCSVGDVFKAAVPTGLKPESTTQISLNPEADLEDLSGNISEKDAVIIQLVESEKRFRSVISRKLPKSRMSPPDYVPSLRKAFWRFLKKLWSATNRSLRKWSD